MLSAETAFPRNEQQVAEWVREGQRGKENFLFSIRLLETNEMIGFFSELGDVLWNNRNCWLAIGIGERAYWDKGYGLEASTLGLDFAFNELNLHRVQLTVFSYNERAIALYEKLGFTREGLHREAILRNGQWYDMILYGMLENEWATDNDTVASYNSNGHWKG